MNLLRCRIELSARALPGLVALLLAFPALGAELPPLPAGARPGLAPAVRRAEVAQAPVAAPQPIPVTLEAGTGRLLTLPAPVVTVLASDPRIARIQPSSPTGLFLMAVAPGNTTVIATAEDGSPVAQFDVTVLPSAAQRRAAAAATATPEAPPVPEKLTPRAIESLVRSMVGANIRVTGTGPTGLVLSGAVPTPAESQRAEAVARAAAGEGREVINNLSLLSAVQVNLRVRVAEISRIVQRDLGFNWQALANSGAFSLGLRAGTGGSVAAGALLAGASATETGGGRFGAGYTSGSSDINAVIDALAADQLITILAEPNLTAQSGEVASFLAGGEFPVPVAASGTTNTITIEFKQFGVSLAFVPTVLSPDRLNLRVRPEVSELSDNGAITVPLAAGVVRIPALSVRRAETTVELGSGQSFAIAGLLQRNSALANNGLALAADIPVLGPLFRSDRFRRSETELVIIVTPYLVRPVSTPSALAAPTDGVRLATDLERVLHRRQIARGVTAPAPRGRLDAGFILD